MTVGEGSAVGDGLSVGGWIGAEVSVGASVSVGATGAVAVSTATAGSVAGEFTPSVDTGGTVGTAAAPVGRLQAVSPKAMKARMTRANFCIALDGIRRLNVKLNADSILTQLLLFYTSMLALCFQDIRMFTHS